MPTNAINDTGVKYLYDKLHGEIEPVAEAVSDNEVTIEGNPLNFNTLSSQNAKSTILSCEPIQDLHGYSKPWVGGAGKNKLVTTLADIKAASVAGTWSGNVYTHNNVVYTVNTDNDGNVISVKVNGTNNNGSSNAALRFSQRTNHPQSLPTGTYLISSGVTTGTNNISLVCGRTYNDNWQELAKSTGADASFSVDSSDSLGISIDVSPNTTADNLTFYPMIRLSTETDATFQPYTNECGISGRTEIGILGEGKNVLEIVDGFNKTPTGTTLNVKTQNNGEILLNGSNGSSAAIPIFNFAWLGSTNAKQSDNKKHIPNGTYKCTGILSNARVQIYGSNTLDAGNGTADITYLGTFNNETDTITVDDTFKYTWARLIISANASFNNQIIKPMIYLATDTNTYSPYTKSNDLTISLGQTVYGGTLDVENGVLVVDRGYDTFNGTESWGKETVSGLTSFYCNLVNNNKMNGRKIGSPTPLVMNMFKNASTAEYGNAFQSASGKFLNCQIDLPDATAWQTYLSSNNLQVVYNLATPIVINLEPHIINLLKGVNNISTDGDKITLTYRDGSVATLGDLTSAVDNLDSKIDESKILTDTATGDKYILVVTNGVLDIQQISN